MTEKEKKYREERLQKIGIAPEEVGFDEHIIRPSVINVFMSAMNDTIRSIEVTERLRQNLRKAVVNGFMSVHGLEYLDWYDSCGNNTYGGRIAFLLPDTIGALKSSVAMNIGSIAEVSSQYRCDLPSEHPDKNNRTLYNAFRGKMLRGLKQAFIAAVAHEGYKVVQEKPADKRICAPLTFERI